jgi:hypothetical protein
VPDTAEVPALVGRRMLFSPHEEIFLIFYAAQKYMVFKLFPRLEGCMERSTGTIPPRLVSELISHQRRYLRSSRVTGHGSFAGTFTWIRIRTRETILLLQWLGAKNILE